MNMPNEKAALEMFDGIANIAAQNTQINDEDYIGDDGLLYCGKCHTRKQTEVNIFGTIRRPYCKCKCAAAQRDAEEAERQRQDFERKVSDASRAGFPDSEMANWTFANDDGLNPKITQAMRRYVDNFDEMKQSGKGLLLWGNVGTGKTYAACEVANALIDKGYKALVTNFMRLTNEIQAKFEGRQELIDSLNGFHLLVVDDLGTERKQEMVFNIVDSRYRAGLPMIVTTNLSIDEIKTPGDIWHARIYDRILERCFPVEMSGASRRRKNVREGYAEMKNMLGL